MSEKTFKADKITIDDDLHVTGKILEGKDKKCCNSEDTECCNTQKATNPYNELASHRRECINMALNATPGVISINSLYNVMVIAKIFDDYILEGKMPVKKKIED